MGTTKQLLAQGTGSVATPFDLYVVDVDRVVQVSSFTVCNRGLADMVRLSISLLGAATATKDYLYYDLSVQAGDTFAAALGFILPASCIVRAYSTTGDSSFSLFGIEEYPV